MAYMSAIVHLSQYRLQEVMLLVHVALIRMSNVTAQVRQLFCLFS